MTQHILLYSRLVYQSKVAQPEVTQRLNDQRLKLPNDSSDLKLPPMTWPKIERFWVYILTIFPNQVNYFPFTSAAPTRDKYHFTSSAPKSHLFRWEWIITHTSNTQIIFMDLLMPFHSAIWIENFFTDSTRKFTNLTSKFNFLMSHQNLFCHKFWRALVTFINFVMITIVLVPYVTVQIFLVLVGGITNFTNMPYLLFRISILFFLQVLVVNIV